MKKKTNKSVISKTAKNLILTKEPSPIPFASNNMNSMKKKIVNINQLPTVNYNNSLNPASPSLQKSESHYSQRNNRIYFNKAFTESLSKEGLIAKPINDNDQIQQFHINNKENYKKQNTNTFDKYEYNANDANTMRIESMLTIVMHYINTMKTVYEDKFKLLIIKNEEQIRIYKVYIYSIIIIIIIFNRKKQSC